MFYNQEFTPVLQFSTNLATPPSRGGSRAYGPNRKRNELHMGEESKVPRDGWSKFRDAATAFAAVAVPLVVAVFGYAINLNLKERDVKIRTVELAISILKDDPKEYPESPKLRDWAMSVIDEYSGIPIPEDAKEELQSVPITRTEERTLKCGRFPAYLVIEGHHSVSLFEDKDGCQFSIDGAKTIRSRCTTIPVTVAAPSPMSVTVTQSRDRCDFSVY